MAFMLGKNLVLPRDKFKYFSQGFCEKQLELVKQKETDQYEFINSFEKIDETKLPGKKSATINC